jgi:hypothetical protein
MFFYKSIFLGFLLKLFNFFPFFKILDVHNFWFITGVNFNFFVQCSMGLHCTVNSLV